MWTIPHVGPPRARIQVFLSGPVLYSLLIDHYIQDEKEKLMRETEQER